MADFTIEQQADGTFLARGRPDDAVVESRLRVDDTAIDRFGIEGASGADIAAATVEFLLRHQRLDQLPQQIDLEDVAAAYDDFEDALRSELES